MKQGIYHLHIPRTSGIFIKRVLQQESRKSNKKLLSGHFFKIDIEDLKSQDYISGHYALTPVPHVLKTFTIIRNPVERTFSYMKYIWEHFYNYMTIEDSFNFFLNNQNYKKVLSNQQSQFLTQEINVDNYNKKIIDLRDMVYSGWTLDSKNITKESVIESVTRNNIEVLLYDDKDLYKKVFSIFEIENVNTLEFDKKINQSVEIDQDFYNKYYEQIYKMNEVDIEVYNFFKESNQ